MLFAQHLPVLFGLGIEPYVPFQYPIRTTSAQKIINQALSLLGVKVAGQPASIEDSFDCLDRLNGLVDAFRTDSLFAYATQVVTATVAGNSASITVGPSGDVTVPFRPIRIEEGSYFSTGGADYSMLSITNVQYGDISYKAIGTIGPEGVYYEPTLPNGTLYFYPRPSGQILLSLQCAVQMIEFADLTTQYALAPGYERMLVYTLAEEVAPEYGRQIAPSAAKSGYLARRAVRRANYVTPQATSRRLRGNILIGFEN